MYFGADLPMGFCLQQQTIGEGGHWETNTKAVNYRWLAKWQSFVSEQHALLDNQCISHRFFFVKMHDEVHSFSESHMHLGDTQAIS